MKRGFRRTWSVLPAIRELVRHSKGRCLGGYPAVVTTETDGNGKGQRQQQNNGSRNKMTANQQKVNQKQQQNVNEEETWFA